MSDELLAAFVGPVIAAILAAFGVWLKEWRQRRNREHKRRRAVSQALEEVAFISAWVQAHERVASVEEQEQVHTRALQDLERTYTVLAVETARVEEVPLDLQRLLRLSLLVGSLRTSRAKAARVLYHLSLVWAVLWTAGGSAWLAGDLTPSSGVAFVIGVLLFGVLPAWALRAFAQWVDQRGVRASEESGVTVCQ